MTATSSYALEEIPIFGAIPPDVLARFVPPLKHLHLDANAVVFREGEPGREMYLVLSGEVEIVKQNQKGGEPHVAIIDPFNLFGEMSLLDLQPRSATARTKVPSHLLRIASEDLDALYRFDLKSYALFVLNIAPNLSRRLRAAQSALAEAKD